MMSDFNKIPAKEGSQLRLFQELKSESTKMAFSLIIAWPYLCLVTRRFLLWQSSNLEFRLFTFTFSHFADAFIQSDLQLGNT